MSFALILQTECVPLTSSAIQLELLVQPSGTYFSSLLINQTLGAGGCTGFTPNLLNQADEATQTKLSGTGITISDANGNLFWYRSAGGQVIASTENAIVIKNISLGGIASEDWIIELGENVLVWNISRMFHTDVSLVSDRLGSFVFMPSFLPTGNE